jgi:hypothetical protein
MVPIGSEDQWQLAAPETVGIDGAKLCALVPRFEEWKEANLHGVLVVRHGKLAFEHYFRGFELKARNGPGIIDFNAATTHVPGEAIDIVSRCRMVMRSFSGVRRSA